MRENRNYFAFPKTRDPKMAQFGELAKNLGYMPGDKVKDVLDTQVQEEKAGKPRRKVGEISVEKKFLEEFEVKVILECQKVLEEDEVVCGVPSESEDQAS
jgi:hypothetical protein